MTIPPSRDGKRLGTPSQKAISEQQTTISSAGKGQLCQGEYNEEESHQQFLDALNAWRSGEKAPQTEEEKSAAKPKGQIISKKMLAGMAKLKASKKPPKVSCYQCFKLYYLAEGEPIPAKDELTFCSDLCTHKFYLHNSK